MEGASMCEIQTIALNNIVTLNSNGIITSSGDSISVKERKMKGILTVQGVGYEQAEDSASVVDDKQSCEESASHTSESELSRGIQVYKPPNPPNLMELQGRNHRKSPKGVHGIGYERLTRDSASVVDDKQSCEGNALYSSDSEPVLRLPGRNSSTKSLVSNRSTSAKVC